MLKCHWEVHVGRIRQHVFRCAVQTLHCAQGAAGSGESAGTAPAAERRGVPDATDCLWVSAAQSTFAGMLQRIEGLRQRL